MAVRELAGEIDATADDFGDDVRLDDDSNSVEAPPQGLVSLSKLPVGVAFRVLRGQWFADRDASSEWRIQANRDFGFVAGDQLSQDDKAYLDLQKRPHVVFNRVLTILKAVAGMEINTRHEIQYLPRETEDTEVNEILTAASKWMAQGCDAEDEESQAFQQCCITGMGWTESRFSYLTESRGKYVEEMIDCREMYWDRTSRKKNLTDARRMFRVRRMPLSDAMRMFKGKTRVELDAVWAQDGILGEAIKSIEEKRIRDGEDSEYLWDDRNEVTIVCAQWRELEEYWLLADEETDTMVELTPAQYEEVKPRFAALGMQVEAVQMTKEVYKQAFLGANGLLEPMMDAPAGDRFSWNAITGEWDGDKKMWFGLTRVMHDPQKWANKFLSQIMQILNATAKGGLLMERSAAADEREFEEGYAFPDVVTWLEDGAISGQRPKVMPKPGQGDPSNYVELLMFAISSIKDTVGINLELIGQQDQNQPGILEYMRKQAGMTVLATLFDALRGYRKQIGRTRLFYIQHNMSDGRLIRVVGGQYAGAVRLAREVTTGEYDVIVDDAPTSPNQKEATWALIQPMLAVFKEQLIANPMMLAMVLEYSPLPAKLVKAMKEMVLQQQNDPEAKQKKEMFEQTQMRLANAKAMRDEAGAAQAMSSANLNNAKVQFEQFHAAYQAAMADNMVTDNERARMEQMLDAMRIQIEAMDAKTNARKTEAEAARTEAEARRTDTESLEAVHRSRREELGSLVDWLGARGQHAKDMTEAELNMASAHREREGAISDRKKATAKPKARASA